MQFHAADQWRVVTGGGERIEANNTEVRIANNLVIDGELDLPSGGMIDWANGDARIVEGETNNYSLSFKTYDGSACNTALRLDGDNSALFSGSVTIDTSGSTVLDIQGSQGQLFSVTDDLSGDLFTVADISGVPILNVNASATSSFDGYLGIGTTSPTDKLEVYAPHSQLRLKDSDDNTFTQFSSSGGKFAIRQDSTSANHFWMNSSGNVAIGTPNFYARLSVAATSHNNGISVNRQNDGTAAIYIGNDGGNNPILAANNADMIFGRDLSGTFTERMRMTNAGSLMLSTSGQVIGNTGEVLYLYAGGTSGAGLEINEPANSIYLKSIDGIFPDSDNTGVIGNSTYTFSNGRFTNFHVDSTLTVRGAIDLADNDILRLGSGDDAEFFVNGSHLYLDLNSGIGNFYIRDGSTTRFTFDDNSTFTATADIIAYSDERLKETYVTAREIAKRNQLLIWAVSQASYDAHDRQFIDYSMLDNSRTGKAGEADIIIGIGKTGSSEVENTVRHICVAKNKLNGWHGMINAQIDVEKGTYY